MDNKITNELELLKASIDGSSAAFEQIVRKYQALICAMTYSATRNVEKSEELAQEAFVRAWKNLKKLRETSKFKPWLCSITNNIVKEHFKSQKRDILKNADSLEMTENPPFHTEQPADTLISKEQHSVVALALEEIPELYRQTLILYYRQEQSVSQVAAHLDLSEENVRTRLHRGRKILKDQVLRMVENTLSGTKPGKAFTVAVMASLTGIAVKGTASAAAATTEISPVSAAGTSLNTIISGLTAKLVIAASIAAVVILSVIIINKKPPQIANDNPTQANPQPNNVRPDATASIEPAKENDYNSASSPQFKSNEENLPDLPLPNTDVKSDTLDGELVNVRVYSNPKTDPAAYSMLKIGIEDRTVRFDSLKEKGDAIVVMLAEDQDHPEIRKQLSRLIYAAYADPNLNQNRSNHTFGQSYDKIPGGQKDPPLWKLIEKYRDLFKDWVFEDLEGNIIEDATVEIIVSRSKSKQHEKVCIGQYKAGASMPRFLGTGPIGHLEFIVSHPDYGVSRICAHGNNPLKTNIFTLPLININSKANSLAASGYVVDPEGNPVAGAEVTCSSVRTPATSKISVFSRTVLTDNSGYFRYYARPVIDPVHRKSGELIPQGSSYTIRIVANDEKLEAFEGQVQNGKQALINLKYKTKEPQESFHTFSFYYGDKKITDPEILDNINVRIAPVGKLPLDIKSDRFDSGLVTPHGKCFAAYSKRSKDGLCTTVTDKFAAIDITDKSPQELVFRKKVQTCSGQIINALTNKPMSGVFVVSMNGTNNKHFSMLTDDQWQSLETMPLNPDDDDPALCVLSKIFYIRNAVRTDADGRFKITSYCPVNSSCRLVYFARNFIGLEDSTYYHKPNSDGVIQIPPRKLYPAAKVTFLPAADTKKLGFKPEWLIDVENSPEWVKDFLDIRKTSRFVCYNKLEYDTNDPDNHLPRSIYVPAGVSLRLRLNTMLFQKYDSYTFENDILLSHGQTLDLGKFNFDKKIYVYVKVIDADDNPLEGFTVHPYFDDNKFPLRPSVSDKKGICEFMVPSYSSGRFAVTMTIKETADKLHEIASVPFEIKGPGQEIETYILKIHDVK